MVKQVYQCGYCGSLHTTMANAEKCESKHIYVKNVKEYKYDLNDKPKFPSRVICEMSDGSTEIFYRKRSEAWR